jgi:hypothetical protein
MHSFPLAAGPICGMPDWKGKLGSTLEVQGSNFSLLERKVEP